MHKVYLRDISSRPFDVNVIFEPNCLVSRRSLFLWRSVAIKARKGARLMRKEGS